MGLLNSIGKGILKTAGKVALFGNTPKQAVTKLAVALPILAGIKIAATPTLITAALPKITSALKSIIPTSTKGKVITAIATPVIIGAVAKAPIPIAKQIINAPVELGKFGAGIAGVAVNPSVESAKELIKESPLLSAGVAAVGLGLVGKTIFPAIIGLEQAQATKGLTEAISDKELLTEPTTPLTEKAISGASSTPESPILPQTQKTTITPAKRRKPTKQAVKQSISQRVNVLVAGKINQKYINKHSI